MGTLRRTLFTTGLCWALAACGGTTATGKDAGTGSDAGSATDAATTGFALRGTVTGLVGAGLTLTTGTEDLAIPADGSFAFPTRLPTGASYSVTIKSQPSGQTCSVTNGSGVIGTSSVIDILVACSNAGSTFALGGTVTGLVGTVVLNNGSEDLSLTQDGSFTFTTRLAAGDGYSVSVKTQPATQTCSVSAGSGQIAADVTGVQVTCGGAVATGDTVMVVRVGTGTGALSNNAAATFLDQRKISDGSLVKAIALPTVVAGTNRPCTLSGTATTEAGLSRSASGKYVVLGCYAAAPGATAVAATSSSTTNRVVARVDGAGGVDTSTRLDAAFTANNIRSVATVDGTGYWAVGSSSGLYFIPHGTTGGVQLFANPSNLRQSHVYEGQLYVSSASSSGYGVNQVGTGAPTSGTPAATLLPGFSTASGPTASSFVIVDRDTAVAGVDTIYLANDVSGTSGALAVQKWTFNGTTWSLVAAFKPALAGAGAGARGLTGQVTAAGVVLVATTNEGATRLVTFTDDGTSPTPAVKVLATAAANTTYRGVAIAPAP